MVPSSHNQTAYTRLPNRERTKKSQLERILQSLDPLPNPAAPAEQYPTPAGIAAEVAYFATARGDIVGRTVVDLGCGNGVLAIAACLLGAARAVGVDSDSAAIEVARRNAERARVDVEWRPGDVRTVRERFDTVLMNPPFGSQTRHADVGFFVVALARGRVIYTFLNAKAESFVRRRIESKGGTVTDRMAYAFPTRRMFPFHRENLRRVDVVLYRVKTAKG
jgi:putative methylase